jgi:hypothetical protein
MRKSLPSWPRQEALLASSALLRDKPQAVLCYTLDTWGGYNAHRVWEFSEDPRVAEPRGFGSDRPVVASHKPLILLVNKGTASSAEAFAAALHDNGRATMLGERTFGKSLIQHIFPLPDGGALKLTVAEVRPGRCSDSKTT